MGVFDKFKSLFIVQEENEQATQPTEEQTTAPTPTPTNKTTEPKPEVSTAPAKGEITNKFLEALNSAIQSKNIEGFDYLEFKEGLKSLEKMPMDEATRFQAAFSMAKAMGATAPKLYESGAFYLKVLDDEYSKFTEALRGQQNNNIEGKKTEIKSINEGINQRMQQIQVLQNEITNFQQKIKILEQDVAESAKKIETTRSNFDTTFQSIRSGISNDLELIKKHLGNS